MPKYVIRDLTELRRWYDEGVTYKEMVRRYKELYDLDVRTSTFSTRVAREGWPPRDPRYRSRIPWKIRKEHRFRRPRTALQTLARAEDGTGVPTEAVWRQTELFRRELEAGDLVVRYEPDTDQGWFVVPRRQGVDKWYIYEPDAGVEGAEPASR